MILSAGCVVQLTASTPRPWWRDVADTGATIVHYLGVMPAILMNLSMGRAQTGASRTFRLRCECQPRNHAAFEARFGFPLIEAWAMTETGGGALAQPAVSPATWVLDALSGFLKTNSGLRGLWNTNLPNPSG